MSTVFVIDDSLGSRIAISQRLASAGYRTRLFQSVDHFLSELESGTPGCLLLDPCVPAMTGLGIHPKLVGSMFGRPVVFLSAWADISLCVNAMKAGAVDFLTVPIEDQRLFATIEEAIRRDAEERRDRAIRRMINLRIAALTPRERQVMEQVVFGQMNKHIAAALGIGEKCVKVHRGRVMTKMGVDSVAELVRLVARVGIALDPEVFMKISAPPIHYRVQCRDDWRSSEGCTGKDLVYRNPLPMRTMRPNGASARELRENVGREIIC